MIFLYKEWDRFCAELNRSGLYSIPAFRVTSETKGYLVLKHDVETNVPSAYKIAEIEQRHGHCGSYYVQAYLLKDPKNVELLQRMQKMGHEISYHYDVMDSCRGNVEQAMREFEANRSLFERNGFSIITVCQHGNPVVDRKGYHSNRDFFRNPRVREAYPNISDIMVNYPEMHGTSYQYFSDAGRQFRMIYDPINNDIVPSDDKNIAYEDLSALQASLRLSAGNIISIHPHRWVKSAGLYRLKAAVFFLVKKTAKVLINVPVLKKIMGRFYYLAKKI